MADIPRDAEERAEIARGLHSSIATAQEYLVDAVRCAYHRPASNPFRVRSAISHMRKACDYAEKAMAALDENER